MKDVKEKIEKGIDKTKELGKKAKEYLIDDTIKDINKILEVNPKEKIVCSECGEELTKHERDACIKNEVTPICFACALKKRKLQHSHMERYDNAGEGRLYCAKCNGWHDGDQNWDQNEN